MRRGFEPGCVKAKIGKLFGTADNRNPALPFHIDLSGDAMEAASAVRNSVAGLVPLPEIHGGVGIAPLAGRPRGLGGTGVFCLFGVPK